MAGNEMSLGAQESSLSAAAQRVRELEALIGTGNAVLAGQVQDLQIQVAGLQHSVSQLQCVLQMSSDNTEEVVIGTDAPTD